MVNGNAHLRTELSDSEKILIDGSKLHLNRTAPETCFQDGFCMLIKWIQMRTEQADYLPL